MQSKRLRQVIGMVPRKRNQDCLVVFQPSGRRGYVSQGKSIKAAAREIGVDIEGVCGEKATCGKCKIRIEAGYFDEYGIESRMSNVSQLCEAEGRLLSAQQQHDGYRLACQALIFGDVVVFVPEESRLGKHVMRKVPTERSINLKPAVKKYCIKVVPATLQDNLGDWERLRIELEKRFHLSNLAIDYQVLVSLQRVIRQSNWVVTVSVWMDSEVIKVEPGVVEKGYGLAVDIGTTTLAGYLCDLSNGEVMAADSMTNPQVHYGEDVMSRIGYAITHEGGCQRLNQVIVKALNQIAGRTAAGTGIKRQAIVDATVVGNTCMHHIFLNLDPQYLGKAPFTPSIHHSLNIKARDLGLRISPGAYVHVLPIEAGFVGADNVGALIAEEPYNQDDMTLIVDIGTNGELVLGNRDRLISASCATGPAFEGGEIRHGMRAAPGAVEKIEIAPDTKEVRFKVIGKKRWNTESGDTGAKGICGSGIIDAIAHLVRAGIVDRSGRFITDMETPRLRAADEGPEFVIAWANETSVGHDIVVCQKDVRNIQLAKGAMYAGAKIIMRRLGVERLDRILLAGAFGSQIDKESAALIGLFPDCALENVRAIGNAAGDGARIALLNVDKRAEAERVAKMVEYVELTMEPDFDKTFAEAMWFPHMREGFPHLQHLLHQKGTD